MVIKLILSVATCNLIMAHNLAICCLDMFLFENFILKSHWPRNYMLKYTVTFHARLICIFPMATLWLEWSVKKFLSWIVPLDHILFTWRKVTPRFWHQFRALAIFLEIVDDGPLVCRFIQKLGTGLFIVMNFCLLFLVAQLLNLIFFFRYSNMLSFKYDHPLLLFFYFFVLTF